MLTPAHPRKGTPGYRDELQQFKTACEDKRLHPENWGRTLAAGFSGRESAPAGNRAKISGTAE